MVRQTLFWHFLSFIEVLVSATIHISYGLVILSSAIATDITNLFTAVPEKSSKIVPILDCLQSIIKDPTKQSSTKDYTELGLNGSVLNRGSAKTPIVLVHGIFGFGKGKLGGISYWAGAEKMDDCVLIPDLGSLTSVYDRACELFYFLKGGTVDFGADHSCQFGHSRFGRTYTQGWYPDWDEDHPLHFVGHSSGVQVIRVLQQLLANKSFPGYEITNANWVLSVTSLSGSLNGTTRTYIEGIRPEDGRTLRKICLLQILRLGVLLYEWLDIPLLKRYYSFGFEHFNLARHQVGYIGLVKTLAGYTGPFKSGDWILPDLSIQSTIDTNHTLKTYPNTYYISYVTKSTRKLFGRTVPSSLTAIHPLLLLRTLQISWWHYPTNISPPYEGYRDEDWHDNDGALNTISMCYPRFPVEHPHCSLASLKDGDILKPGIWYYTHVEADHIFFIINRNRAGVQFDTLYNSIFQRCRKQMNRLEQKLACTHYCACHEMAYLKTRYSSI
ncbi:hypothetical protein O6H91_11G014800 [Diphasiastrum complanatum]|uniref:Uncharacterized protein n=2 Tax=Diphasiastrum complanatum TaxID=34168 RepID=A0ACC2C7N9_DIPCM|nr:hypothetical protein O6H91_11G014800 [Diphasiastrum complanatum]KAJ7537633.1 hypothetical protein O6H91_11G014800 [Diphasiastrum complanatum]